MTRDQITEKKEDFSSALLIIQNLAESDKIGRFKFTPREQSALLFVSDLLAAHLKELEKQ